jgi:hypothetical protein
MTTLPTTNTNGKIPNCPFWEQAVRDCLHNADSIIADPNLLSDEENDWMLQEASQLSADALEKAVAEQDGAEWTAYSERMRAWSWGIV